MTKVIGLYDVQRKAATGRPTRRRRNASHDDFPSTLAAWIRSRADLIESLAALRRLGDDGREALDALLSTKPVATARTSWQLFEALAEGAGEDPEVLLLKAMPPSQLESARRALWGPRWDEAAVGDLATDQITTPVGSRRSLR